MLLAAILVTFVLGALAWALIKAAIVWFFYQALYQCQGRHFYFWLSCLLLTIITIAVLLIAWVVFVARIFNETL